MYSDHILTIASIYAANRKLTLSTLGTYLARDGKFFGRLADGRVTIRLAEHVLQSLSDHWPEGLEWPEEIPRPTPSRGEEVRARRSCPLCGSEISAPPEEIIRRPTPSRGEEVRAK